jgi:hypothetical protein
LIVEAYAPNHALLSSIQQGDNFMNRHYLLTALRDILKDRGTTVKKPKPKPKEKEHKHPPQLQQFYKEQKLLIRKRIKLSNSFHDYLENPRQCAKISDQLRKLHTKIRTVTRKIEYYHKYQMLPPEPLNKKFAIPKDNGEKRQLLGSLLSSRSQYRKKVREETNEDKIARHQKKLENLEAKIITIREALNKSA